MELTLTKQLYNNQYLYEFKLGDELIESHVFNKECDNAMSHRFDAIFLEKKGKEFLRIKTL